MWRALKREVNPRSLITILGELGIIGWNLHNAGNDAVYTLQAMLGIACKHLVDRKIERKEKDKLKKDRISEYVTYQLLFLQFPSSILHVPSLDTILTYQTNRAVKEAVELAYEREEGWSSDGSDGGDRITPEKAEAQKAADAAKKAASKRPKIIDPNELWRDGTKPATATASISWAGTTQGVNQAQQVSQAGWGTPPATPIKNDISIVASTPASEPTLISAEEFGYDSSYKSPIPKYNISVKPDINLGPEIKATQDQTTSQARTSSDWGAEWSTRDTMASIPVSTDQPSTSTSAPFNTDITNLEKQMQTVTLAELQQQGKIPMDLSANAFLQRQEQDKLDAVGSDENPWGANRKSGRRVKW